MPSDDQATDRPLPAWLVSVAVHTTLLVLAVLYVGRPPRGAADEPGRDVGIVLKRATADGAFFEGPDADAADVEPATEAASDADALAALPDAAADGGYQALLPKPPDVSPDGIGASPYGDAGTAADMAGGGGARSASAAGGAARVRVFGVEGEGRKFVYVFDRSQSMYGAPLAAAKRQLIDSLQALGPTHQFQVLFFNHRLAAPDLTAGQDRVAFADDRAKRLAESFVVGVGADGSTDRKAALRRALQYGPDVVFFLTDADNAMTSAEIEEVAKRNRRVGATICTIEFGQGPPHGRTNFLVRLASMTGGQYGYVDTTRLGR